jgi:hypothetical protein
MNTLKNRLYKAERACVCDDPSWRYQRGREFSRNWIKNVEPLFAEIYGNRQTKVQIYEDHMKILNLYPDEKSYVDLYVNQGKEKIEQLFGKKAEENRKV